MGKVLEKHRETLKPVDCQEYKCVCQYCVSVYREREREEGGVGLNILQVNYVMQPSHLPSYTVIKSFYQGDVFPSWILKLRATFNFSPQLIKHGNVVSKFRFF